MSNLTPFSLTLEPRAGSHVAEACLSAQHIADTLGVLVSFKLNDVQCYAHPGGDSGKLLREWRRLLDLGKKAVEVASSHLP